MRFSRLCIPLLWLTLSTCFAQCAAVQAGSSRSSYTADSTRDVLLDSNWEFRSLNGTVHPETATWRTATVPGVVPLDLLAAKLIPDPFYRDNEQKLQWMGLTDWEYRTTLNVTSAQLAHRHVELVFDGLDTFADVFVNDQPVLHADNMFRTWRLDVKGKLHAGANSVRVVLHSAINTMLPK